LRCGRCGLGGLGLLLPALPIVGSGLQRDSFESGATLCFLYVLCVKGLGNSSMEGLKVPLEFWIPLPGLPREDSVIVTNTLIVVGLILVLSFLATRKMTLKPKGLQNILELVVDWLMDMLHTTIGKQGSRYLPLVASLFLFILVSNIIGLIPGFISPTSNLNTNLVLALVVVLFATPFVGIQQLGLGGYLKHKGGPIPLLAPFVFAFETIGEMARPISLTVRLFTNIKSGDILLLTMIVVFLVMPYNPLVPMLSLISMVFGLFVAFVQAYVFAFLTVVYFAGASGWGEGHA
jgi:F-type H+-transporting ATPase subunit a